MANTDPSFRIWTKWRRLVNMSPAELRRFMGSPDGKVAGLSRAQASAQGIRSGRDSAKALLEMIPTGSTFTKAVKSWSPGQWAWARRQVSFNSRMRAGSGPLYRDGEPTRRLLSLLIWGHDPERPLRPLRLSKRDMQLGGELP